MNFSAICAVGYFLDISDDGTAVRVGHNVDRVFTNRVLRATFAVYDLTPGADGRLSGRLLRHDAAPVAYHLLKSSFSAVDRKRRDTVLEYDQVQPDGYVQSCTITCRTYPTTTNCTGATLADLSVRLEVLEFASTSDRDCLLVRLHTNEDTLEHRHNNGGPSYEGAWLINLLQPGNVAQEDGSPCIFNKRVSTITPGVQRFVDLNFTRAAP